MARMKAFDETLALEKAMRAFWSTGYDGTSMQMLEKAMGLKRTSIYNAYGNKRALFNQVILHYQQTIIMDLMASVESEPDIRKAIANMLNGEIDLHFNHPNPGGCLIVLSVLEKAQHGDESSKILEQIVQQMEHFLFEKMAHAQQEGQLSQQLDIKSTSLAVATTVVGISAMGKAGFSKASLRKIVAATTSILDLSAT
jgi:TetR/AcrR family transcriptional regulator, transcriptional repressor for nem operon